MVYLLHCLFALACLIPASLLVEGEVLAATYLSQEICGKKVDFDNSGGSGWAASLHGASAGGQLCSVLDKDQDGYVTDDCNDSDPNDFPGVYGQNGCSAGQSRYCKTDGSGAYAAACSSTFVCPGLNCYFISPTGSDSAAGTIGAPWLTFGPITQNDPGGGTTRHTPVAGDVFVVRGGTYATNKDVDSTMLYLNSKDGTALNPIVIMGYPNETPDLQSPNTLGGGTGKYVFKFVYADYLSVIGLKFSGGYGDPIYVEGDGANEGQGFKAFHNFFNAPRGYVGDNVNSVKLNNVKNWEIHNNYFFDWSAVVAFRNRGGRIHHNVAWLDSASSPAVQCFSKKHADEVEAGDITIDHNICVNYNTASSDGVIWTAEQNSNIHHNIIAGCTLSAGVTIQGDPGGPAFLNGDTITNNTFINCANPLRVEHLASLYGAIGTLDFSNNVIVDNSANYTGTSLGLLQFNGESAGAAETERLALFNGTNFTGNGNCFYNASVSGLTGAFEVFPTAAGGSSNNLTAWNAISGVGTDIEQDPAHDSQPAATSVSCVGKGWIDASSVTVISGGGGARQSLNRKWQ